LVGKFKVRAKDFLGQHLFASKSSPLAILAAKRLQLSILSWVRAKHGVTPKSGRFVLPASSFGRVIRAFLRDMNRDQRLGQDMNREDAEV